MSTSTLTSDKAIVVPNRAKRSFFKSGREDSPFKRIVIHIVLILACIVSVFRCCVYWRFPCAPVIA